jgi:hypothetical protein
LGEKRKVYRALVMKHEGKKLLGRSKRRWEDSLSLEIDFKELGCQCMNWSDLSQDRGNWWAVVNALMKLWIP